jgi:hypothetical protein
LTKKDAKKFNPIIDITGKECKYFFAYYLKKPVWDFSQVKLILSLTGLKINILLNLKSWASNLVLRDLKIFMPKWKWNTNPKNIRS